MNLALSALLIILFLLPAFFFRIGISIYIRRKKEDSQITHDIISRNVSKALSKLNFTETVFLFSIIPIILHLVSLCLIRVAGGHIDYELLLNIFSGKQNILAGSPNDLFQGELLSFLGYTLIETGLACILGWILIRCLSGNRWLLKNLMGNNVWFKLFTGATLTRKQKQELANILVEVLVEIRGSSVIYSGLLKNYEILDNTDNLAYLILTGAVRRDLRKYGNIIPIPGHVFTIAGKEIINLNVTYMKRVIDPLTQEKTLAPIDF